MKKQIIAAISTHPVRAAFLLILLFLLGSVMHQAVGQGNTGKRSVAANLSQIARPLTGAAGAAQRVQGQPVAVDRVSNVHLPNSPALSPWTIVANYPLVSESVAVASNGAVAYAAGGFAAGSPTNAFNLYDPVANTWTPLPNAVGAFYDAPAVYAANTNSVYVFGGIDATFTPSNVLQIYHIASGTWTTGAPMPGARYFASGAYYAANGKIYVIGGFDSTFVETSTTWEYDPVANTWNTTRASIPVAMAGAGYSIVGQNIYLAGTWNGGAASTVHYRYDIVANAWTVMAPVPVPIYRPAAAGIGTNTYLVGGGNPDLSGRVGQAAKRASTRSPATSYNSTYIYDTLSNSWSTGPNTNAAHSFTGGTAIGTKLIVVTGFDGVTGDTNTVELADAGGGGGCTPGTWVTKAPYPLSVYGAANVTDGTYAYAFGGNTIGGAQHAEANRYDPVANSWSALASMTAGPDYLFHGEYGGNGKIYVMGGLTGGTLNRIYTIATNAWSSGAAVPVAVYDHGHAYSNGKIYVIGGLVGGSAASTVYAYDVATNTWSAPLAPLPQAEFNMACGVIGGKIYVAGGSTGSDFITNLYIYNIATNSWSSGASMGLGANFPAGTVVGGKLWVIGGGNPFAPASFDNTQIYDPATNSWSTGPVLNQARSFADAVTLNGAGTQSALIVGGYNSTLATSLTSVEMNTSNCGGTGCQFQVLIVYADSEGAPTALQSQILAESGVTAVDFFDAVAGTPTLAQLQQYDIVVPFSNSPFLDADTLGNNLADYVDGGGVAVQLGFSHYGPSQPYGVNGRWVTGNYNPYNYSTNIAFSAFSLGSFNAGHPLMAGVTTLNSDFQNVVAPAAGATQVAAASNSNSLVAYRPVSGGHTTVGVTAYVGEAATQSGDWGKVIVNAGRWLGGSCGPVPSSAVSRKVHGAFTGDINLPLVAIGGAVGIECRNGAGGYQMVVTFPSPVTVGGVSVTSGTGSVGSSSVSGGVVTINLIGVADTQRLGVTLANVNDGTSTGDVLVPMGVLIGDSAGTGNGSVNAGDVGFVKSVSGQTAGAGNFRADIAINGTINASDVGLVKANSGHLLPP